MGRDFVGVIKAKGRKVKDVEVGDKVWGVIEPHQIGAFAEYVVLDHKYVRFPIALLENHARRAVLTDWSSVYTSI